MKVAYCPYCQNVNRLSDCDWGLTVQCEGPSCEKFFPTGHLAAPGAAEPTQCEVSVVLPPQPVRRFGFPSRAVAAQVEDEFPRLTGSHVCQVCGGDVFECHPGRGFGERRHTILHSLERGRVAVVLDNCRTDLYSAVYHCPACRALLETPVGQWGTRVACPVLSCQVEFIAPIDDLVHRRAGDAREGRSFAFACPVGCGEIIECDTARKGEPTAGLSLVCPRCRHVVTIPPSGAPA